MNNHDVEDMLGKLNPPTPTNIPHQQELKIPILSYRRSSRIGFVLLLLPVIIAIMYVIKFELAIPSTTVDSVRGIFRALDDNPVFTYLIPAIFVGLPCVAMFINFLAISHVVVARERRELLITVKYRFANIMVFLLSLATLVFYLLPDRLSF